MALCEEILASEILSRVWTATLSAADRIADNEELEPIGRSVLVGHLEARNRVLHLIAAGRSLGAHSAAASLNRLRRVCERWTDFLLAPLASFADLASLAHDRARMADMADDYRAEEADGVATPRNKLLFVSLKSAFPSSLGVPSLNADLHSQIAAGVLACFDPEALVAMAPTHWLWHTRVMNATTDAERWVGELLE